MPPARAALPTHQMGTYAVTNPRTDVSTSTFPNAYGSIFSRTTSAGQSAGATTLSFLSTSGFVLHDNVAVQLSTGVYFQAQIASIGATTITLSVPLSGAVSAGAIVYRDDQPAIEQAINIAP